MNEIVPYLSRTYYGFALDPIHIGTGGYRLGQVDLTIIREPGTDIPKIPGSSLEGTSRAYTAIATGKYRVQRGQDAQGKPIFVSCAGKGGSDGSEHCGKIECPVCVSYGFSIGSENRSFHGLAQFYDAQILFFPVNSMVGPVWVTWPDALAQTGFTIPSQNLPVDDKVMISSSFAPQLNNTRINLGWINLEVSENTFPVAVINNFPESKKMILNRMVCIPNRLATIVINSNLETRTSVSIDPATGAAKDKALYTYEAIPRGTVFELPITYLNPQHFMFPSFENGNIKSVEFDENKTCEWVEEQVLKGLNMMRFIGVGGMNTRGFGRLEVCEMKGGHDELGR